MKQLFSMGITSYAPGSKEIRRPSVRGIIFDQNGRVALIYSRRYHFYKFPGGGIEGNETHAETLAREILEETGMNLILGSMAEFGEVLRMQNGDNPEENTVFIQENFYYTCQVRDEIGAQNLDEAEKEQDFVLKFVDPKEAARANAAFESEADDEIKRQMAERDRRVLEMLEAPRNL